MSPHSIINAQPETRNTLARLELLERTAAAMDTGSVSPFLLQEALSISHKLAGALGMFGFDQGTLLARVLEQQLESATPNGGLMLATINELREVLFPDTLVGSPTLIASN